MLDVQIQTSPEALAVHIKPISTNPLSVLFGIAVCSVHKQDWNSSTAPPMHAIELGDKRPVFFSFQKRKYPVKVFKVNSV